MEVEKGKWSFPVSGKEIWNFYNLCPRKFIPIGSQSPMCDAKQCRLFDKKKRCNYLDTAWAWRQHWTLSASNQTGFSLEVHVYILAFCSYVRRNLMKNQKLSNGHVSLGILWKNNISIYCIGKEKEVKIDMVMIYIFCLHWWEISLPRKKEINIWYVGCFYYCSSYFSHKHQDALILKKSGPGFNPKIKFEFSLT